MAASSARVLSDLEMCNRNMGRICGAYRVVSDHWWNFRGSVSTRTIGSLEVADIRLSNGRVIKDRKRDEYYLGDRYFLVLQASGAAVMRQRGCEAYLRPGDCTLIDSRYQSTFEVGPDFHQYSFHLSGEAVQRHIDIDSIPVVPLIKGSCGPGALLSDTLASLLRHGETLDGLDLTEIALQLLGRALGAKCPANRAGGAGRAVLDVREIANYIDAQIDSTDLTPKSIAEYFDVSLRQLYRISADAGLTPAALIWRQRLDRARDLLMDPRTRNTSITEIAMRCGFKDGAHFSRSYRKSFGEAPRVTRRYGDVREGVLSYVRPIQATV